MVSRVGDRRNGAAVVAHLHSLGIDTSLVSVAARATASYTAILEPNGELVLGLADMDLYDEMVPGAPDMALDSARLRDHALWFADANLPAETIAWLLDRRAEGFRSRSMPSRWSRRASCAACCRGFPSVRQPGASGVHGGRWSRSAMRRRRHAFCTGSARARESSPRRRGYRRVDGRRRADDGRAARRAARCHRRGRRVDRRHVVRGDRTAEPVRRRAARPRRRRNHRGIGFDHGRAPDRGAGVRKGCATKLEAFTI